MNLKLGKKNYLFFIFFVVILTHIFHIGLKKHKYGSDETFIM
jgi:hypothetical protein